MKNEMSSFTYYNMCIISPVYQSNLCNKNLGIYIVFIVYYISIEYRNKISHVVHHTCALCVGLCAEAVKIFWRFLLYSIDINKSSQWHGIRSSIYLWKLVKLLDEIHFATLPQFYCTHILYKSWLVLLGSNNEQPFMCLDLVPKHFLMWFYQHLFPYKTWWCVCVWSVHAVTTLLFNINLIIIERNS